MTTDRLPKVLLNYKQEDTEISDDQWLDGKTHSLEVGNRPAAYILEVEEFKISWRALSRPNIK
jgi:hypothetical protein